MYRKLREAAVKVKTGDIMKSKAIAEAVKVPVIISDAPMIIRPKYK